VDGTENRVGMLAGFATTYVLFIYFLFIIHELIYHGGYLTTLSSSY
jgi:hypothetical protein